MLGGENWDGWMVGSFRPRLDLHFDASGQQHLKFRSIAHSELVGPESSQTLSLPHALITSRSLALLRSFWVQLTSPPSTSSCSLVFEGVAKILKHISP